MLAHNYAAEKLASNLLHSRACLHRVASFVGRLSLNGKLVPLMLLHRSLRIFNRAVATEFHSDIRSFRREIATYIAHLEATARIDSALKSTNSLCLELGARNRPLPGWIAVGWGTELPLDLRRSIPFPDNSVEHIYSSHLLEHFSFPHPFEDVLRECYRILRPGGRFEAAVPDGSRYLRRYYTGQPVIDEDMRKVVDPRYLRCLIDELNWFVYMDGNHKYLFNQENVIICLREVGFVGVELRDFNPELDLESHRDESIYVSATKT